MFLVEPAGKIKLEQNSFRKKLLSVQTKDTYLHKVAKSYTDGSTKK